MRYLPCTHDSGLTPESVPQEAIIRVLYLQGIKDTLTQMHALLYNPQY